MGGHPVVRTSEAAVVALVAGIAAAVEEGSLGGSKGKI